MNLLQRKVTNITVTAWVTINPPLACSKAGIVGKPRFPGSVRSCYLDSKLEADKGRTVWLELSGTRSQIPSDRYKGKVVRVEQQQQKQTVSSAQGDTQKIGSA